MLLQQEDAKDASAPVRMSTLLQNWPRLSYMKIALAWRTPGEGIGPRAKETIRMPPNRKLGAIVEEVSLPHSKYGVAAYYIIASSEVHRTCNAWRWTVTATAQKMQATLMKSM